MTKSEYLLPIYIDELLQTGKVTVQVLKTPDKWFGVTYQEDKPAVQQAFCPADRAGGLPVRPVQRSEKVTSSGAFPRRFGPGGAPRSFCIRPPPAAARAGRPRQMHKSMGLSPMEKE